MDNVEHDVDTLTAMNDAEYVLSCAVEILTLHEQGVEGYGLEELIFTHYNALIHYFTRGGGYVEALGGIFRQQLRIEYQKHTATLIVDKMKIDGYMEQAPFRLEYKMQAPKFISSINDVVKGKVESKVIARSIEGWKTR